MNIWILTTGNSDVILKNDKTWGSLYGEVRYEDEFYATDFASPPPLDPRDKSAGYTVPARVLGLVYEKHPDYYKRDLEFPLLDTYCKYFGDNNQPQKIIILLTDQSKIFDPDQILYEKCPYWQDTCTLRPLLEWYFKDKSQLEFLYLTPNNPDKKGIDNWNETLSLVEKTLPQLDNNELTTVYVSHQAGTPAISSAVQFVSLGRFKNVKFLVSNEYFDENENYKQKSESEAIESSNYWRGMQIQKAKQLIIKGLPAAAKEILIGIVDEQTIKQINQLVDLFNINNALIKGQEFEVKSAVERIVTALDLVEIFFKQENYIQGIAILNATQETFLKAAIISQTQKINDYPIKLSSLVDWDQTGLFVKSQTDIKKSTNLQNPLDVLRKLKFPNPDPSDFDFPNWEKYQNSRDRIFKLNNSKQFKWLCELRHDFKAWGILEWSCQYKRKTEDDLRNQLLHNLVGVYQQEVCDYLLGYNNNSINRFLGTIKQLSNDSGKTINVVYEAYRQDVKLPFLKALKLFGLWREQETNNKLESKLKEIADSLT
ncbi:hypothetical protein VF14_06480 [Nostoc linckia z18]|uniref:Uncharacterized protein n=2 Tax=Nostoc linckia TaxID=92942 RepID=A0A9Q5ZB64_NOSLI|nr:hypothetical protein [Nostoc linckia]PHK41653.1 hypothetical protein VF12_05650 [Nostoc linckia z15]PHK47247.1 hypothetical protein VF13_06085 [Nostoc linckia z16]PHJ63063.1 hypothetical protein VF02_15565 [Nostoc linckia z1]PHJ72247.1 hypothetical protein VF05_04755 [Nostoc linckia z3]PHJ75687.1 hypothetical protein VF03_09560 [Nostoc linckia z2]